MRSMGIGMRWAVCEILAVLCVMSGCGVEGLHNANPKTTFRFDPVQRRVEFSDNKNNDVYIGTMAYTPDAENGGAKTFKLENLFIKNNASEVRQANGEYQMAGMALQATANWNGANQLTGTIFQGLAQIVPYLPQTIAAAAIGKLPRTQTIATPWGSLSTGVGFSQAQIDALLALAGTQTMAPVHNATTQPAN